MIVVLEVVVVPENVLVLAVLGGIRNMGVSEKRGTLFGVLLIRILLFRVLC